jgi:hypothetical protein
MGILLGIIISLAKRTGQSNNNAAQEDGISKRFLARGKLRMACLLPV